MFIRNSLVSNIPNTNDLQALASFQVTNDNNNPKYIITVSSNYF